jgi:hypothetical protein
MLNPNMFNPESAPDLRAAELRFVCSEPFSIHIEEPRAA